MITYASVDGDVMPGREGLGWNNYVDSTLRVDTLQTVTPPPPPPPPPAVFYTPQPSPIPSPIVKPIATVSPLYRPFIPDPLPIVKPSQQGQMPINTAPNVPQRPGDVRLSPWSGLPLDKFGLDPILGRSTPSMPVLKYDPVTPPRVPPAAAGPVVVANDTKLPPKQPQSVGASSGQLPGPSAKESDRLRPTPNLTQPNPVKSNLDGAPQKLGDPDKVYGPSSTVVLIGVAAVIAGAVFLSRG